MSAVDTSRPSLGLRSRHFAHWRHDWPWVCAVAVIALLAAAPVLSIAVMALTGEGDPWPHLAATVLPAALADTATLLAGVAAVTIAHRRHDGLARHGLRVPGPAEPGMGAPAAAGDTDLHHRLCLGRDSRLFRAGPERAAGDLRVAEPSRLLVPRGALDARRDHDHGPRPLPLRLSHGAGRCS